MDILNPRSVAENEFNADLFGGNILATSDQLGDSGTYDNVAVNLGLESIRYPGVSLSEHYFDLTAPDNDTVADINSGQPINFLPYSDRITYAGNTGKFVTIVLPTQKQLSQQVDANGDRYAQID